MNRYKQLLEIVRDTKPKHIIEMGTWNGKRAIEMMAVSNCYYTGFDLFEEADKDTDLKEFNVKPHNSMVDVAKTIEMAGFSKFCLIRGNSNETLPKYFNNGCDPFDFAFIDGGHSVDTIENDFRWISDNIDKGGTIIMDDWYEPELPGLGCNFIDGEVLPSTDRTSKGIVHLLKVQT